MATQTDTTAQLKQFRQTLEQQQLIHSGDTIGTDDATLLRFLRARQFDLDAAVTMWRNCQEWRKNAEGVGIDELYRRIDPYDYPEREDVFNYWPLWFHKTDKQGRPLNIHHFGGINTAELYKHITPEKFWQTIIVNAESLTREILPAAARAAGKEIGGTSVIVDLKGFSIRQFWQMQDLAKGSFQISQDYYPETMAHLTIINAPMGFSTIWSFIKPWLAKETVAKVEILGSDYRAELLRQVDPENLPAALGGECTCSEAGGCDKSNAGPWSEGRKERRERWLKGEGPLQLGAGQEGAQVQPGEAQKRAEQEDAGKNGPPPPPSTHREPPRTYAKESEVVDAAGGAEKSADEERSSGSSSMPSTPRDDEELTQQAEKMSLEEHAGTRGRTEGQPTKPQSHEASVERMYRDHPETRQIQTGDLHKDEQVSS